MDTLLLLALNGLIWNPIITLIALGLSIIFGLLDIINIAHGDFFMVGTVLAWFTLELTGSFWVAFLIVPLIGFILGALVQRVVIQPIRNVAALTIVATFGLSLILQEGARITFGTTPRRILPPIQSTFPVFGIKLPSLPAVCRVDPRLLPWLDFSFSCTAPSSAPGCARYVMTAKPRSQWGCRRSASTC